MYLLSDDTFSIYDVAILDSDREKKVISKAIFLLHFSPVFRYFLFAMLGI